MANGDDGPLLIRAEVVGVEEASANLQRLRASVGGIQTGAQQFTTVVGPAFAREIDNTGRAAGRADAGLDRVRRQLTQFALVAAGVPGPLGRVAATMGQLAAGGGVTLAVVAGLALVAQAVRALRREAEEARRPIEDLIESLRKQETAGFAPGRALEARLAEREKLRARQAGARAQLPGLVLGSPEEVAVRGELLRIEERLLIVNHDIGLLRRQGAVDAEKTAAAAEREAEAVDRMIEAATAAALARPSEPADLIRRWGLQAQIAGGGVLPGTFGARLLGAEAAFAARPGLAEDKGLIAVMEKLGDTFRAGKIDVDIYARAIKDAAQAHKDSTAVAVQAIFNIAGVVQSLIRGGGGVGGFLSGVGGIIGGIVAASNPLAGAIIGAGSGVLGALFDRGDRSKPVSVVVERFGSDARRDLRPRPQHVTVQFLGERGQIREVIASILREQALGGEPLLPAGF